MFFRDKIIPIWLHDVNKERKSFMETNRKPKPTIAGIGEILWDLFPDGGRLGGAPANFACHCNQLGAEAYPVSCIGDDELGLQTRAQLERLGVNTRYLQESREHETGKVLVSLDESGKPSYQIPEGVAFDFLTFTPELKSLAQSLDAVCFGVLSQRSARTRGTIYRFLREMPQGSVKIFDVNLREPFFSKERIESSLQLATVLKLSDEELPVLADYFDLKGDVIDQLTDLRSHFKLNLIAYTRGPDGSILIGEEGVYETPGLEITAVDSVGAGDSFTAALCTGLLAGMSLTDINIFANKVAAFVCSSNGACPIFPPFLSGVSAF